MRAWRAEYSLRTVLLQGSVEMTHVRFINKTVYANVCAYAYAYAYVYANASASACVRVMHESVRASVYV